MEPSSHSQLLSRHGMAGKERSRYRLYSESTPRPDEEVVKVWVDEATEISYWTKAHFFKGGFNFNWNSWTWEQNSLPDWYKHPEIPKAMTALGTICRSMHWTMPTRFLVFGSSILTLPFKLDPLELIPAADPYEALCGCCRAPVGFVAAEVVPDTEWMD